MMLAVLRDLTKSLLVPPSLTECATPAPRAKLLLLPRMANMKLPLVKPAETLPKIVSALLVLFVPLVRLTS